MSLKSTAFIALWSLLATLSACVSAVAPASAVVLNNDTVRLEGWFSVRGEWTLFSMSDFKSYNPYVKDEDRCVSLIKRDRLTAFRIPSVAG
jgi:hypothetical protein